MRPIYQNVHLGSDEKAEALKRDLSDLRPAAGISVSAQTRKFLEWLVAQHREAIDDYRGGRDAGANPMEDE